MASSIENTGRNAFRWDRLGTPPPVGERLTVRLADPDRRGDLFLAVDSMGRRGVLLHLPACEDCTISGRFSRGIQVHVVEMNVGVVQLERYIEITCLDSAGHAALDLVIEELISSLAANPDGNRGGLVQEVLSKWKRFWSGIGAGALSSEQLLGLFGELWFLSRWLAPTVGFAAAMDCWRGPLGARNDFERPLLGIEVKCSNRQDGACIINGLEQLIEPEGGSLLLFHLSVREEGTGTQSLAGMIHDIKQSLAHDADTLSRFETLLMASGYDEQQDASRAGTLYRVRSEELFHVTGDFPRIVPSSFGHGIPRGVGAVRYELRLDAAEPWLVASSPDQAPPFLVDLTCSDHDP